jgi:prepilin-type N-terminal cleavage/methylation domain-containing protein
LKTPVRNSHGIKTLKSQGGFTLIELMITVGILATMTVLAAQSIQQAIRSKSKIQGQIDDVSRMRDTLRLIEGDINLAFHYRDVEKEIQDLANKKTPAAGAPGAPGTPPIEAGPVPTPIPADQAKRIDPSTNFIGTSNAMDFVTMNNARMVRNSKQADFIEVGYSLKPCKGLSGEQSRSDCLWRRTTAWVDEDVTKGGDEVVLLENVTEFKLRYIGKGKDDWSSDWRTDSGGDQATKGNFPASVEVSLTVETGKGTKKKKYSMQIVARVHFPNNKEETDGSTGGTAK